MTYRGEQRPPLRRTEINPSGTAGPAALAIMALLIAAAFLFFNSGGHGPAKDAARAQPAQQSSLR